MKIRAIALTVLLLVAGQAFADTVGWTDWTSSSGGGSNTTVNGVLSLAGGNVTVTYSGETGFVQTAGGTYYWNPNSTFTSATVSNAPGTSDIIAINGTNTLHTISFSQNVLNPVMAIESMGQGGVGTTYAFDTSFILLSQGPTCCWGTGSLTQINPSTLVGFEGAGTIQFLGSYSSISWYGANPEFWNGITVGAADLAPSAVPEPASMILVGSGLMAGLLRLRRKS
jgi:hypothetical protein